MQAVLLAGFPSQIGRLATDVIFHCVQSGDASGFSPKSIAIKSLGSQKSDGRVGGRSDAANRLGIKRTTFIPRMKKLRIEPECGVGNVVHLTPRHLTALTL
jgi:hypothetical protein